MNGVTVVSCPRFALPRQRYRNTWAYLKAALNKNLHHARAESKKSEDEWLESEEKYRTLFENAPVGLGVAAFRFHKFPSYFFRQPARGQEYGAGTTKAGKRSRPPFLCYDA